MRFRSQGNFFSLPNEIFLWGLTTGELAVYSFLRRCEDRKTRQCWPSIGSKKKKVVHFCTTFKTNLQIIKKWVGPYRTHPWSECNYRTWKNPVISMVCKQQARGSYP